MEEDLRELSTRLEDLQPGKYQRKLKEQASRLIELEEELEAERKHNFYIYTTSAACSHRKC